MLTNEQIDEIEKRFEDHIMTFDDLYLLESHIFEIGKVQDEYGDTLPYDVLVNLEADLKRIIAMTVSYLERQGIHYFPKKSIDND